MHTTWRVREKAVRPWSADGGAQGHGEWLQAVEPLNRTGGNGTLIGGTEHTRDDDVGSRSDDIRMSKEAE